MSVKFQSAFLFYFSLVLNLSGLPSPVYGCDGILNRLRYTFNSFQSRSQLNGLADNVSMNSSVIFDPDISISLMPPSVLRTASVDGGLHSSAGCDQRRVQAFNFSLTRTIWQSLHSHIRHFLRYARFVFLCGLTQLKCHALRDASEKEQSAKPTHSFTSPFLEQID